MNKQTSRKTNRLTIANNSMYWKVIVTPSHGKPVVAVFDNRYGADRMGNTPTWFIKALQDLRNVDKYPHLQEALPRIARIVENSCINNSRDGAKRPWADIELDLRDAARVARDGEPESLANTYQVTPDDDEFLREMKGSRDNEGFARGMGNVEAITEPVCDGCRIVPCWC
jgi:hypothetical protein